MNVIQTALKRHPRMVRWIRLTREKILVFPQSYDQSTFGEAATKSPEHPCGAAACLAGQYAMVRGFHLLKERKRAGYWVEDTPAYGKRVGRKIVKVRPADLFQDDLLKNSGLDDDDQMDAAEVIDNLFGMSGADWPAPFGQDWLLAGDDRVKQARVAARRLTYFLQKGE